MADLQLFQLPAKAGGADIDDIVAIQAPAGGVNSTEKSSVKDVVLNVLEQSGTDVIDIGGSGGAAKVEIHSSKDVDDDITDPTNYSLAFHNDSATIKNQGMSFVNNQEEVQAAITGDHSTAVGRIVFYTSFSDTLVESMRLDQNNRIGLGTTLLGGGSITDPITIVHPVDDTGISIFGQGNNLRSRIIFDGLDGTGAAVVASDITFIPTADITQQPLGPIVDFSHHGTTIMQFDSTEEIIMGVEYSHRLNQGNLNIRMDASIPVGTPALAISRSETGTNDKDAIEFQPNNDTLVIGSIEFIGQASVVYNQTSDPRLKEDFQQLDGALEFIDSIVNAGIICSYRYKDTDMKRAGFNAHKMIDLASAREDEFGVNFCREGAGDRNEELGSVLESAKYEDAPQIKAPKMERKPVLHSWPNMEEREVIVQAASTGQDGTPFPEIREMQSFHVMETIEVPERIKSIVTIKDGKPHKEKVTIAAYKKQVKSCFTEQLRDEGGDLIFEEVRVLDEDGQQVFDLIDNIDSDTGKIKQVMVEEETHVQAAMINPSAAIPYLVQAVHDLHQLVKDQDEAIKGLQG